MSYLTAKVTVTRWKCDTCGKEFDCKFDLSHTEFLTHVFDSSHRDTCSDCILKIAHDEQEKLELSVESKAVN